MDDRWGNIDLVFRNGLKDFEALPPQEIWDNIQPAIKKKSRPVILYRAAALTGIILTAGLLSYFIGSELPARYVNTVSFLDIIKTDPVRIGRESRVKAVFPQTAAWQVIKEVSSPAATMSSDKVQSVPISGSVLAGSTTVIENEITASHEHGYALPGQEQKTDLNLSKFPIQTGSSGLLSVYPEYTAAVKPAVSERWSIAAMASPTYYSRFSSERSEYHKELMLGEQSVISYSGGIAVSYKINKKFSIQTGIYYASNGQQVEGINSFGGFQQYIDSKGDHNFEVLTSSGTIYSSNPDIYLLSNGSFNRIQTHFSGEGFDPQKASLNFIDNTIIQNFSYLQLPVVVRYKLFDRAFDFNLIGGMSYDLLVNNSVYAKTDGVKVPVGETKGLNHIAFSSSLGMGMEYNFSRKVSLNLEPTFRYFVNPFSESSGIKTHPYSFGVFSGLSYKF